MRAAAAALAMAVLVAPEAAAQAGSLDLDHVFIAVPTGGRAEIAALERAGFTITAPPMRHEGQGTASVAVLFPNAYVELIWADPTVSVEPANEAALASLRRAAAWRTSGASPFGIGLRRGEGPLEYGVPARRHSAAWMRPGTAIDILRQPEERRAAEVRVVPEYMAITTWGATTQRNQPELFRHPGSGELLTAIELRGPEEHEPQALQTLGVGNIRFREAAEPLLIVQLEGGTSTARTDFRPLLPLIITR